MRFQASNDAIVCSGPGGSGLRASTVLARVEKDGKQSCPSVSRSAQSRARFKAATGTRLRVPGRMTACTTPKAVREGSRTLHRPAEYRRRQRAHPALLVRTAVPIDRTLGAALRFYYASHLKNVIVDQPRRRRGSARWPGRKCWPSRFCWACCPDSTCGSSGWCRGGNTSP